MGIICSAETYTVDSIRGEEVLPDILKSCAFHWIML